MINVVKRSRPFKPTQKTRSFRFKPVSMSIDECDKSFQSKGHLSEHIKQVHGLKQHQCSIYLKSFSVQQMEL